MDKLPISYKPTITLFAPVFFFGLAFSFLGISTLFYARDIKGILISSALTINGIWSVLFSILKYKRPSIRLEAAHEGINYYNDSIFGFYFAFSIAWKDLKKVDIRTTGFNLLRYRRTYVYFEKRDGTINKLRYFFFTKKDLSEFFSIIRQMNPNVVFTQNVLNRVIFWD